MTAFASPALPCVSAALQAATAQGLPRLDGQLLLLHVLQRGEDRAWLITHDQQELTADQYARWLHLLERRVAGEPLAYLVGHKEFFGLSLAVDARVLIPRPDTETLVEWALALLAAVPTPRLLDLGTGSGAIALALAHQRADAEVHALDASAEALAVAQANARQLGLDVCFWQGHWLNAHPGRPGYDLIVSNPPYIADGDAHLPALVHEPRSALTAGADGLADIRTIIEQSSDWLRPDGWLLLEHGHDQAAAVRQLLLHAGYTQVESRRDLAGIERCSGARKPIQR
jgi:release factor glutamine methyltransferase